MPALELQIPDLRQGKQHPGQPVYPHQAARFPVAETLFCTFKAIFGVRNGPDWVIQDFNQLPQGTGTMAGSAYPYFAENLRQLCSGRESISQVCRDLGINRQQFGKYLSGKLGASEQTLETISTYFGVSKVDLLYAPLGARSEDSTSEEAVRMQARQMQAILAASDPVRLRPGLYFCLYSTGDFPDHFVRSVVSMRRADGLMFFTRWFTTYPLTGRSKNFNQRTDGIVLQHGDQTTLIGQDIARKYSPSMMRFAPIDTHQAILTGITIVSMAAIGTMGARATLVSAGPSLSLRRAMRICGIRKYSEEKLDELVLRSLQDSTAAIQPYKPGLAYFAEAIRGLASRKA